LLCFADSLIVFAFLFPSGNFVQTATPTKNFHFLINLVIFFLFIILLLCAPCFVFRLCVCFFPFFFCFVFLLTAFNDYINAALIAF